MFTLDSPISLVNHWSPRISCSHPKHTVSATLTWVGVTGSIPVAPTTLSFPKIPSGLDSRSRAESSHHEMRCLRSFMPLEWLSPT